VPHRSHTPTARDRLRTSEQVRRGRSADARRRHRSGTAARRPNRSPVRLPIRSLGQRPAAAFPSQRSGNRSLGRPSQRSSQRSLGPAL